jgi:hypothetical protein
MLGTANQLGQGVWVPMPGPFHYREAITAVSDIRDESATKGGEGARRKSEPELDASIPPQSMIEIALNCAGFFVGLLIMTGDYVAARGSLHPTNWQFLESPTAMVWIFFVAAQFAFWANIVKPLWSWLSGLRRDYALRLTGEIRLKLAAAMIFFALPGFILVFVVPASNLAHHDLKQGIVNLIAMIVAILPVAGIWYVHAALEATFTGKAPGGRSVRSFQETIKILLELRSSLQHFITVLGAIIVLATLAKGALRQAFLATGGNPSAFPSEYVLLQGAYFTGLLALVYIPTYTSLAGIGADLLESAYPVTAPDLDWDHLYRWQQNRKSLEELLQLRSGAFANLRGSVSILAPVATSFVSVLLAK